jgi:hypothetical protein
MADSGGLRRLHALRVAHRAVRPPEAESSLPWPSLRSPPQADSPAGLSAVALAEAEGGPIGVNPRQSAVRPLPPRPPLPLVPNAECRVPIPARLLPLAIRSRICYTTNRIVRWKSWLCRFSLQALYRSRRAGCRRAPALFAACFPTCSPRRIWAYEPPYCPLHPQHRESPVISGGTGGGAPRNRLGEAGLPPCVRRSRGPAGGGAMMEDIQSASGGAG